MSQRIENSDALASGPVIRLRRPNTRRSVSRTASRALDLLEYFGETRRPLRAIEIARALDLHPSTANQMLKTLVESGHLIFDGRAKTYLPSPRLIGFSAWNLASYGAEDRYGELLRRIYNATGTVVTLTTPNDLFMQVIDVMGSPDWMARVPRGMHVSIFGSPAVGNAYFSAIPDREIERLSERARLPRAALPPLLRRVAGFRSKGFAEGVSPDGLMYSIAIPLPLDGPVPLIVGISDRIRGARQNNTAQVLAMREAISTCFAAH